MLEMTSDAQHTWQLLLHNPREYAHKTARELTLLSNRYGYTSQEFTSRFNELLNDILDTYSDDWDIVSTVTLWFTEYNILVIPHTILSFDRFHERCGTLVKKYTDMPVEHPGREVFRNNGYRFV